MKHRAGSGSVYKRGNTWTIDYYVRGKRIRESVRMLEANRMLAESYASE